MKNSSKTSKRSTNDFWINATDAYNSCILINRKDNSKPPERIVANENESVSEIDGQNRFTFIDLDTVSEDDDYSFTTLINPNNNNQYLYRENRFKSVR
jgi:hypothetical protein